MGNAMAECLAELSVQSQRRMASGKRLDESVLLMKHALEADDCRVISDPKAVSDLSGFASTLAVTVETRKRVYAVLEFFSREPGFFDAERVRFAQTAANIVAAAIGQNRAVQNLRRVRRNRDSLISAGPAAIYGLHLEGESLTPHTVSQNIVRLTGYGVRDALRKEWWQEHAFPQELLRAMADGSGAANGYRFAREYELTRADGKPIWIRDEARVVVGGPDGSIGIVGSLTDATEQKAMEAQFHRAQKMEAFGEVAGGISHNFSNLLTVIAGFSYMELANPNLAPDARKSLEKISEAAAEAIQLNRELVKFSRHHTFHSQPLDLRDAIGSLMGLFRRVIPADINLRTSVSDELPPLNMGADMVEQILLKLTVNARDAMRGGGDLEIRIDRAVLSPDEVLKGRARRSGVFVRIDVQDTGGGMSPETMAHIFDPFFTMKGAPGTGFGLFAVDGMVRRHDGWIEVESKVGGGSRYSVFLPAASGDGDAPGGSSGPGGSLGRNATILVVEDHALVRSVTETFLSRRGYKVLTAENAAAVEGMLAGTSLEVDLMITHVVLPGGMSGLEIAERACGLRPDMQVLYMSGYHATRGCRGIEHGRNFIRKPFDLDQLAGMVEDCLGGR